LSSANVIPKEASLNKLKKLPKLSHIKVLSRKHLQLMNSNYPTNKKCNKDKDVKPVI
jgi:hypothetical protein